MIFDDISSKQTTLYTGCNIICEKKGIKLLLTDNNKYIVYTPKHKHEYNSSTWAMRRFNRYVKLMERIA
jgi:hypothetical protein